MLFNARPAGTLVLILTLLNVSCPDRGHSPPAATARRLNAPDASSPTLCVPACLAQASYLCLKDSKQKRCVECSADTHCASNTGSLGARCDTRYSVCTCSADSDCKSKAHGTRCALERASPSCGCASDAHCPAPRKCLGLINGARVCALPCKADADCASPASPRCDTASGRCVACTSDTQCPGKYAPRCHKTLGTCAECTADTHCAAAGNPRCDPASGRCTECVADADCKTGLHAGNRCLASTLGGNHCRCKTDTDCSANASGPSCDASSGRCTCKADADCKVKPYTLCALPFVDAGRSECSKPCTDKADCGAGLFCHKISGRCVECKTDTDCADSALKYCDTARQRCVACKSSADCSGETPICDTASGACVACKVGVVDCSASPDGKLCGAGTCSCSAVQDCQASAAWGGRCVTHGGVVRCGCISNADCAGKAHGPTCVTIEGKCSCQSDADCKLVPGSSCQPPYPGAKYKQCQQPCKADSDCPSELTGHCHKTSGFCVACTTSAHCAGESWSRVCNSGNNRCVECINNADCTSQTLGAACTGATCTCSVKADCKGNVHGAICHKGFKVCSCTADSDCPTGRKCSPSTLGGSIKLCK